MATEDKKKAGGQPLHGAYAIARVGSLPAKLDSIEPRLSEVRRGLVRDFGPLESDLSTAQAIMLDRVLVKIAVMSCVETYVARVGPMAGGELAPCLGKNYLAWSNSLRLDLQALSTLSGRAADRVQTPLEVAAEVDREAAQARDEAAVSVPREDTHEKTAPGSAQDGRSGSGEGKE